jgi:hypothetical protein
VDATYCGGDLVGWRPWPSEALPSDRSRGPAIYGNHDDAIGATRRTAAR